MRKATKPRAANAMKPPTPTTTPMMVFLVLGFKPLLPEEPLSAREGVVLGEADELVDESLDEELLVVVDDVVGAWVVLVGGAVLEVFEGLEVVDEESELVFEVDVVVLLVVVVVEVLLCVVEDEDEDDVVVELDEAVEEVEVVEDAEVAEELLSVGSSPPRMPPRPVSCRPTTFGLKMVPCEMATAARRATTDFARNSMMVVSTDGGWGVERRIQRKGWCAGHRDCRKVEGVC